MVIFSPLSCLSLRSLYSSLKASLLFITWPLTLLTPTNRHPAESLSVLPELEVNGTLISASTTLLVDNRIICAKVEASSAYLYCNNQLLAEGTCSINEDKLSKITNFSVCPSVDMWATFMCMANGLTSDEETIMYNAIDTFLTTIGKRN